jgi:hypothetical protein
MIVNKALIAATVLLFTAPVVPALAHDDYGDHVERWGLHRDLRDARYIRCLECPENWRDNYGWRRYWWRRYYGWPHYYRGWRYGGWPYGGWRYGGWEYEY